MTTHTFDPEFLATFIAGDAPMYWDADTKVLYLQRQHMLPVIPRGWNTKMGDTPWYILLTPWAGIQTAYPTGTTPRAMFPLDAWLAGKPFTIALVLDAEYVLEGTGNFHGIVATENLPYSYFEGVITMQPPLPTLAYKVEDGQYKMLVSIANSIQQLDMETGLAITEDA